MPEKICVVCGADCAGRPRVKDPKGRYFCEPCYEEAKRRHAAKRAAPRAPDPAPPTPDPDPGPSLEALDVDLGLLDEITAPLDLETPPTGPSMPQTIVGPPEIVVVSDSRGTVWPTVIGLVSLIFGAGGLIVNGLNMAGQFAGNGGGPSGSLAGKLVGSGIAVALSLWLTVAAIGIMRRNQMSVASIRRWAITKIALYSSCLGCVFGMVMMSGSDRLQLGPEMRDLADMIVVVILVFAAWSLFWPIFVLLWFRRDRIQDDITDW